MFACGIDSFGSTLEWKSTDCHKPHPPHFFVMDVDTFNQAVVQFNSYVSDVQRYIDCLVAEARGDLRELPDIIGRGVESAEREALNEVDNVRSDLEFKRRLLQ